VACLELRNLDRWSSLFRCEQATSSKVHAIPSKRTRSMVLVKQGYAVPALASSRPLCRLWEARLDISGLCYQSTGCTHVAGRKAHFYGFR